MRKFIFWATSNLTITAVAIIEIGTDLVAFQRDNRNFFIDLFLNIISISAVFIMTTIEILVFINLRKRMLVFANDLNQHQSISIGMSRITVFIIFLTSNMATCFLPRYAMDLIAENHPSLQAYSELLIAIPISADILFSSLTALLGSQVCKLLGLRRASIISAIFFVMGLGLEFAVRNIFVLIIGSAVSGLGMGTLLFIINMSIINQDDETEKEQRFAGFTAAMTSGVNSGIVLGAFLLNYMSQRMVIATSALFSMLLIVFTVKYTSKISITFIKRTKAEIPSISTFRFIFSPNIFIFFFALLLPIVASGYFLFYLFPIVGFQLGMPESYIGYSFLLNSIVIIIFGTSLTKIFSEKLGKSMSLVLWAFIYGISFVIFALWNSITSLLIAIVIMGLADSFGQSLYNSFYVELPQVERYGYGKAIGICQLVENLSQSIGPFMFSYILVAGLRKGLIILSISLVCLTVIFMLNTIRLADCQAKCNEKLL